MKFNVLGTLREIRDDRSLVTAGQRAFLFAAALRTDNKSGRVRASQAMLANDAGLDVRSVRRYMQQEPVARYFVVETRGRQVNLSWRPLEELILRNSNGHAVVGTGHRVDGTGPDARPSTSSSTPSSTNDDSLDFNRLGTTPLSRREERSLQGSSNVATTERSADTMSASVGRGQQTEENPYDEKEIAGLVHLRFRRWGSSVEAEVREEALKRYRAGFTGSLGELVAEADRAVSWLQA